MSRGEPLTRCEGSSSLSAIESLAADEGLLLCVLRAGELPAWCVASGASRLVQAAIRGALPTLRGETLEALRRGERLSLWELCRRGRLNAVWARVTEKAGSLADDEQALKLLVNATNGNTVLHETLDRVNGRSADQSHDHIVSWVLSRPVGRTLATTKNMRGQTPLHVCARYGHVQAARRLLARAADAVDARDNYCCTPLLEAVDSIQPAMVKVLLEARANPNAFKPNCHGHGSTPLIDAVQLRDMTTVALLLATPGIDLRQKSMSGCPFGKEPLDFAPPTGRLRAMLERALAKELVKGAGHCGAERAELAETSVPRREVSSSPAATLSSDQKQQRTNKIRVSWCVTWTHCSRLAGGNRRS